MQRFLLFSLLCVPVVLQAQSRLERYFLQLPAESVLGMDAAVRKQLVAAYQASPESPEAVQTAMGHFQMTQFLPTNGFCSLVGAFEGDWSMCYWVTTRKEYIVAVAQTGCGPACYMEYFQFFRETSGALEPIDDLFEPLTVHQFFDTRGLTAEQVAVLEEAIPPFVLQLPAKGTDIEVWVDDAIEQEYPSYAKRLRTVLRWQDGRFVAESSPY